MVNTAKAIAFLFFSPARLITCSVTRSVDDEIACNPSASAPEQQALLRESFQRQHSKSVRRFRQSLFLLDTVQLGLASS